MVSRSPDHEEEGRSAGETRPKELLADTPAPSDALAQHGGAHCIPPVTYAPGSQFPVFPASLSFQAAPVFLPTRA